MVNLAVKKRERDKLSDPTHLMQNCANNSYNKVTATTKMISERHPINTSSKSPIIGKFESFGKKMRFLWFMQNWPTSTISFQFVCWICTYWTVKKKEEEDELCVQMNEQSIELCSFWEKKKRKRPRTRIAISRIISEIFVTCFSCIFKFLSRFFFHSVVTDIVCPRCDAMRLWLYFYF